MSLLELRRVTKRFGKVVAVSEVSLAVGKGEILSLLGPSGCGKSTTLRIIAGLTKPDSGSVIHEGRDITELPPEKRNFGMVFQNYALWPHMTVFDNVAFGLRMRGWARQDIARRVKEVLELVKLSGMESRYPTQLSGGQQQRVALARALAPSPSVLLMDEPLSNLDAKLREELRHELRSILRSLRITTIYVTHDQAEAMALSDKIAVMNAGRIVQTGTPAEIYREPADPFVATFIGESIAVPGSLLSVNGSLGLIRLPNGVQLKARISKASPPSKEALLVLRPEAVSLGEGENSLKCRVSRETYMGERVEYRLECEGVELKLRSLDPVLSVGEEARVVIDPSRAIIVGR
ncbi:MAG: ABC transporter ATP-binding protein [Acidilobaceae archaeon]|nr:ABC transporter ATP-binding protein [Acidilobaceae archaeon]MDW7973853.1 ABC transporter ATP-binding protein [Sulfolobales archaeon]